MQLGLKEVVANNIKGQAVTPYLLKRLNEITHGASLGSNIDLVENNAKIGSQVGRREARHITCRSCLGDLGGFGSLKPCRCGLVLSLMTGWLLLCIQIAKALFDIESDRSGLGGVTYSIPTTSSSQVSE